MFKNKSKKLLALLIVFSMLIANFNFFNQLTSYADIPFGPNLEDMVIKQIRYQKNYNAFNVNNAILTIVGRNLDSKNIKFKMRGGALVSFETTESSDEFVLQYKLPNYAGPLPPYTYDKDWACVENFTGSIQIQDKEIDIFKDTNVPTFSKADKFDVIQDPNLPDDDDIDNNTINNPSYKDTSQKITLYGSDLDKINDNDPKLTVKYGLESGSNSEEFKATGKFEGGAGQNQKYTFIPKTHGDLGYRNIWVSYKDQIGLVGSNAASPKIDLIIENVYIHSFRMMEDFKLKNARLIPNRGQKGSYIQIFADNFIGYNNTNLGKDLYGVYFLDVDDTIDKLDPYKESPEVTLSVNNEHLRVKIPTGTNFNYGIKRVVIFRKQNGLNVGRFELNERFHVEDSAVKPKITSINPKKGPNSGTEVQIIGINLLNPKMTGLEVVGSEPEAFEIESATINNEETQITITYKTDYSITDPDDKRRLLYNRRYVKSLKRIITVNVGEAAKFVKLDQVVDGKHVKLKMGDKYDEVYVIARQDLSYTETNPVQPVDMHIETIVETEKDYIVPQVTLDKLEKFYDGNRIQNSDIKASSQISGQNIAGKFNIVSDTSKFIEPGTYLVNVEFVPDQINKYESITKAMKLVISKPKVEKTEVINAIIPKISEDNKKLSDALPDFTGHNVKAGNFKWDMPNDTTVEQGKAYAWTYTPSDTAHYLPVKGIVVLYPNNVVAKESPIVEIDQIDKNYDGNKITDKDINGNAEYNTKDVAGVFKIISDPGAINAGTYNLTVRFYPNNSHIYKTVDKSINVTINKADAEDAAIVNNAIEKIYLAGKKIKELKINLDPNVPNPNSGNGFTWGTSNGETTITKGTSYTWTYTPQDTTNYKSVSGTVILYPDLVNYDELTGYKYTYHNDTSYKSFTFLPSSEEPVINSVLPESVQVEYITLGEEPVKVKNKTLVCIEGEKFLVNKYTRQDGSIRINYPIVQIQTGSHTGIGNYLMKFDPNEEITVNGKVKRGTVRDYNDDLVRYKSGDKVGQPIDLEMEFLTKDGLHLDGVKQAKGERILIYIPKDIELPVKGPKNVQVINPSIGGDSIGGTAVAEDIIDFKVSDGNDNPVIASVEPNVVVVDSATDVIVRGANFKENIRLFIDGIEVKDIKVVSEFEAPGKRIEFKSPKGRLGKTQLLVMNPSSNGEPTGPSDVADFYFIESYGNKPELFAIRPPRGSKGTFVTLFGDNYFEPDPTVKNTEGLNIYRLIGSRVILDGKDVNQYNLDTTGSIVLKDYESAATDLLLKTELENTKHVAKLNEYADAVVLYDEDNDKYYTIKKKSNEKIILTDGINNTFEVKAKAEDTFVAIDKDEHQHSLDVSTEGLTLTLGADTITLKMKTAYKTENKKIIGKQSKVVTKDIIEFYVPILYTGEGLKDVEIINPDTQSVKKEKSFKYLIPSDPFPEIESIIPSRGPVEGGYYVEIKCKNMVHSKEFPVTVNFGGIPVPAEDILFDQVNNVLEVKVPKYPRDLSDVFGTSELAVTVSVVRNDGASAFKEDGFTYVKIKNNPEIISMNKEKGSANGGESVKIMVKNLRFKEPFKDNNVDGIYNTGDVFEDLNNNNDFDDLSKIKQTDIIKLIHALENNQALTADQQKIKDLLNVKAFTAPDKYEEFGHYFNSPILPVVRFGSKKAKIVEFTKGALNFGYIKVITPSGTPGDVDVVVTNCDAGVSNAVKYTYTSSEPEITYISPDEGSRVGGEKINIYGARLYIQSIESYSKDGSIKKNKRVDSLVRFGDLTNEFVKAGDKNDGDINKNFATVELAGGLQVKADLGEKTIDVRLEEGGRVYTGHFTNYDGREVFIPAGLLKDAQGYYVPNGYDTSKDAIDADGYNTSNDYELIRVRLADNNTRFVVSRGFSPNSKGLTRGRIELFTPSYYDIGKVNVSVFNPDGGIAVSEFTYTNPASKPIIESAKPSDIIPANSIENKTNIDQRMVQGSTQGGGIVFLKGRDFREGVSVFFGETQVEILDFINEEGMQTLKLRIPAASENVIGKKLPIMVKNKDGGIAISDDIKKLGTDKRLLYFIYRKPLSLPTLTDIFPKKTSQFGGHEIKIMGEDIRTGAHIILGTGSGEPIEPTEIDQYGRFIKFITPNNLSPGPNDVQVQNADFGLTTMPGGLQIISYPQLDAQITDGKGLAEVTVLSTEGKQIITLKGKNFMQGAKVYFGGERVEATNSNKAGVKGFFKDDKYYILSGAVESPKVEFVDTNTLKVETPKINNEKIQKITVINPDEGISDDNLEIKYSLPKPSATHSLKVTIVNNKYIKLYDYQSLNVKYYTVYAYIGKKKASQLKKDKYVDFKALETTNREPYKISRLDGFDNTDKNSYIHFVVKGVNNYGSSTWSNIATLKYSDFKKLEFPKDEKPKNTVKLDESFDENAKVNVKNDKAEIAFNKTVSKASKTKLGYDTTINVKDFEVLFSKYIVNNSKDIGFETPLFYLTINPKSFSGSVFTNYLKGKGAYGSLNVKWKEDYNTSAAKSRMTYYDRKLKTVSPVISFNTSAKTLNGTTEVPQLNQAFKVAFKLQSNQIIYDKNKALYLYKYDIKKQTWARQNYDDLSNIGLIRFYVDSPSYYVLCQY